MVLPVPKVDTNVLLTGSPRYLGLRLDPLDLHDLSVPPAFILSQNQTLLKELSPDDSCECRGADLAKRASALVKYIKLGKCSGDYTLSLMSFALGIRKNWLKILPLAGLNNITTISPRGTNRGYTIN